MQYILNYLKTRQLFFIKIVIRAGAAPVAVRNPNGSNPVQGPVLCRPTKNVTTFEISSVEHFLRAGTRPAPARHAKVDARTRWQP